MAMISLIITTCNRPALLQEAIESSVHQKYIGEIIVINDGYKLTEPVPDGIKVIDTQGSIGVCAARSLGLAEASFPYITYLDDDDRLHADAYLGAMELLETGNHNLVVSNVELFGPIKKQSIRLPASTAKGSIWGMDFNALPEGTSFFTKQSAVYRTGFLRSLGGWENRLKSRSHTDLFFRISRISDITGVNWPCYRLRRDSSYERLTGNICLRIRSLLFLIIRHFPLWATRTSGWRWLLHQCQSIFILMKRRR